MFYSNEIILHFSAPTVYSTISTYGTYLYVKVFYVSYIFELCFLNEDYIKKNETLCGLKGRIEKLYYTAILCIFLVITL